MSDLTGEMSPPQEIPIRPYRGWPKGKPRGPRKQKDSQLLINVASQNETPNSYIALNGQINQEPAPNVVIAHKIIAPRDILRNFAINSWNEFMSQYDPAGQEYMKNVIRSILK